MNDILGLERVSNVAICNVEILKTAVSRTSMYFKSPTPVLNTPGLFKVLSI